jgi:hypothetical protein
MPKKRFEIVRHKEFYYAFDKSACQTCKALCCKGEGYVFLSKADIERISNFLKIDKGQFLKLYTKKVLYDKKISLINLRIAGELRCVFLDNKNRCEIYDVRPSQCKNFPFWDNLKNKNEMQLAKLCPGIIISY